MAYYEVSNNSIDRIMNEQDRFEDDVDDLLDFFDTDGRSGSNDMDTNTRLNKKAIRKIKNAESASKSRDHRKWFLFEAFNELLAQQKLIDHLELEVQKLSALPEITP